MSTTRKIRSAGAAAMAGLLLSLQFMTAATGYTQPAPDEEQIYDLSALSPPPACVDNRGMKVTFRKATNEELRGRIPNFAASFRDPDVTGAPFVILDVPLLAQTPPEFQYLIYYHECAHHELGHMDRHSYEYSQEQRRALEAEADCEAGKSLAVRQKYTPDDMSSLFEFMSGMWRQQGQPYRYIQHRINRTNACYKSAPR